jgi:hypothetical protein
VLGRIDLARRIARDLLHRHGLHARYPASLNVARRPHPCRASSSPSAKRFLCGVDFVRLSAVTEELWFSNFSALTSSLSSKSARSRSRS